MENNRSATITIPKTRTPNKNDANKYQLSNTLSMCALERWHIL